MLERNFTNQIRKGIPTMGKSKRKTSDAVELMDNWYGGDPEWDRLVLEEELKVRIGQLIYKLRTDAGLSQTRLAERTGLTQAMISKVENADYDGDYFKLLLNVCFVFKKKLEIGEPQERHSASKSSSYIVSVT